MRIVAIRAETVSIASQIEYVFCQLKKIEQDYFARLAAETKSESTLKHKNKHPPFREEPVPGPPSLRAAGATSRKPGCTPYGPEAELGYLN